MYKGFFHNKKQQQKHTEAQPQQQQQQSPDGISGCRLNWRSWRWRRISQNVSQQKTHLQPLPLLLKTNILCGFVHKEEMNGEVCLHTGVAILTAHCHYACHSMTPDLPNSTRHLSSWHWQQMRWKDREQFLTLWCWLTERHRVAIGQYVHQ